MNPKGGAPIPISIAKPSSVGSPPATPLDGSLFLGISARSISELAPQHGPAKMNVETLAQPPSRPAPRNHQPPRSAHPPGAHLLSVSSPQPPTTLPKIRPNRLPRTPADGPVKPPRQCTAGKPAKPASFSSQTRKVHNPDPASDKVPFRSRPHGHTKDTAPAPGCP